MFTRLTFINGSPKTNNSFSTSLIATLRHQIDSYYDATNTLQVRQYLHSNIRTPLLTQLSSCNTLVIVTPLYTSSLPAPLLEFLTDYEYFRKTNSLTNKVKLYAFINCGYKNSFQTHMALSQLQYFAKRAGLDWQGGVGLGSGEMFKSMEHVISTDSKTQRPVYEGISTFAECLKHGSTVPGDDHHQLFVTQGIPLPSFIFCSNFSKITRSKVGFLKLFHKLND